MNHYRFLSKMLIASALLVGCSTVPPTHSQLEEARNDFKTAQANAQVATLAPAELKQASDALDTAHAAWSKREDAERVAQLAYLAKQRVAIAQETAKLKGAEQAIATANVERDKIRLEARTTEAERAQQKAEESQRLAQASQAQSMEAQRQLEETQRQAQTSQERAQALDAQLQELKELNAKKTERGLVITLGGDVLFDTNKAQLKSGSMRNVQKIAEFLKKNPERKVLVEGFTDSRGSEAYNKQLSEKRAEAVRQAIMDLGMSPERVQERGYGEDYPVASNANAVGRQLNRRVEIVVSDETGNIPPRDSHAPHNESENSSGIDSPIQKSQLERPTGGWKGEEIEQKIKF